VTAIPIDETRKRRPYRILLDLIVPALMANIIDVITPGSTAYESKFEYSGPKVRNLHGYAANISGVTALTSKITFLSPKTALAKIYIDRGKTMPMIIAFTAFSAVPIDTPDIDITRATMECQPVG
jgi:hypothetical protein